LKVSSQLVGAVAKEHLSDDLPPSRSLGLVPGRPVDPEGDLIWNQGLGVVDQCFLERIRLQAAHVWELADDEVLALLGCRGEGIPGRLLATEATTGLDRTDCKGRQDRGKIGGIFGLLHEPEEPLPREGDAFGYEVVAGLRALDVTEPVLRMQDDSGQDAEERGMESLQ